MMKKFLFGALLLFSVLTFGQKEIYELRAYDLKFGTSAKTLYNYLDQALIPALNSNQVYNIGIFDEISETQPKKIYVFIPFKNIEHYYALCF